MQTTEEGNKLIAEFMGWRFEDEQKPYKVWNPEFVSDDPPPNDWVYATWIKEDFDEYVSNRLKYHASWDWLMPACQKFDRLYKTEDLADNMDYIMHCENIDDCVTCYNDDAYLAFEALATAIQWHNSNTSPVNKEQKL